MRWYPKIEIYQIRLHSAHDCFKLQSIRKCAVEKMEEWKRQVFALIAARKMNCGAGCNCSGAEHLECITSYFFEQNMSCTLWPYGNMALWNTMALWHTTTGKNGEWRGSS